MNDDFLYRLRTEPPAHFTTQLKERLDRGSNRKLRVLRFGLGVLLFGTAFAMVSPTVRMSVAEVIDWIRGVPPQTAEAPAEANQGLARAFGDRKVEEPITAAAENTNTRSAADEIVRTEVRAMLDAEQARRRLATGLPDVTSTPDGSADDGPSGANDTDAQADASAAPTGESQSGFIVTGPLLGEVGTAAYAFETRRAYFTVVAWYMKALDDQRKQRTPVDRKVATTDAYRLASLIVMMPDVFTKDWGASDVPTRSNPAVWSDRSGFMMQSLEFALAVKLLMSSAKSADDARLRELIGRIDSTCTNCHEKFRQGGDNNVGAVYP